jgi:hypothetical protein
MNQSNPVCVWCEEVILPKERIPQTPLLIMHRECAVRSILGSIAHIQKQCSCYGGDVTDYDLLPGLTKRQQARLAYEEFCKNPPRPPELRDQWAMRDRAKLRPANFEQLSGEDQWEIDKKLGILDWDGK